MPPNVSVLFVNGLGDQLIALPAVRALARLFPNQIQLMLGEGNYRFMFADAAIRDEPVRLCWIDSEARVLDVDRLVLEAARTEMFISLALGQIVSSKEIALRFGPRRSVGFFDCFTDPLPRPPCNMFDLLFSVPKHFDPSLRFDDFAEPPRFEQPAEEAAARLVESRLTHGEKLLFVHPESNFANKTWSAEHFTWVLENFLDRHPEYRVLVCSKEPYPLLPRRHQGRFIRFNEHLQLSLATMRHADLFLGVDSCFLHAADLFRVPSVALFGPTEWQDWGIRLAPHFRHVVGNGSMEGVRREEVLQALLAVHAESSAAERSGAA